MKRGKGEPLVLPNRTRLFQILMGVILLYLLFMSFEIPLGLRTGFSSLSSDGASGFLSDALPRPLLLQTEEDQLTNSTTAIRPSEDAFRVSQGSLYRKPERQMHELKKISGLVFNDTLYDADGAAKDGSSELHKAARHAWVVGKKLWHEIESGKTENDEAKWKPENHSESCPHSISLSGSEFRERKGIMVLPCGLTLWSHLTVVGTPLWAHAEHDPKISMVKEGDDSVMVSQFMMELQGLKTVDKEEPPRVLHFNPRLKGDWSGKPVIEQNTCYRMQWGSALRCEGWKSRADEETGD